MKNTRWNPSLRFLSVILVLAFLICQIPVGTFSVAAESTGTSATQQEAAEATIVAEDVSKREESVKHFRLSDGTYRAVQYDVPVHYMKDDKWVDYDNTLVDGVSDEGEADMVNTSADYEVRLSKKTTGKKWVRLEKDGYKISWYYVDGAKSTGVTTDSEDDGDLTTLEKAATVVTYPDVYNGVDLRYRVGTTGLKEDIILKKAGTQTVFTAEYNIDKLTAVQTDAQTIELRDADGMVVYALSAPYMVDANGVASSAMTYRIVNEQNKRITVELTADAAWLAETDREYPVTVDPSVETGVNDTDEDRVISVSVSSGQPDTALSTGNTIQVGVDALGDEYKSLLKISTLPELEENAVIVSSQLYLTRLTVHNIGQIRVNSVSTAWEPDEATWNAARDYTLGKMFDVQGIGQLPANASISQSLTVFDITQAVIPWYRGITNNGIMLSRVPNGVVYAAFCSSSYAGTSGIRPTVTIDYRTMMGLEDYWTYTGVEAGRSGSAAVNNFNGNLIVSQPITQNAGGNFLPVSFALIYNSSESGVSPSAAQVGNGWRTNFDMRVTEHAIDSDGRVGYYYYTDSDGTKHAFPAHEGATSFADEDGLGYTITKNNDGTYTITDKEKSTMTFNADGFVTQIANLQGHTILITYDSSNRLKTVTDGANRVYTLSYTTASGKAYTTITDPAGRATVLECNATRTQLTKITFPDAKTVGFAYSGKLTEITGNDNSKVTFAYDKTKISSVTRSFKQSDSGAYTANESYSFNYKNYVTTVTDIQSRRTQYQFDAYGLTTGVVSLTEKMGAFYAYEDRLLNPLKANKLSQESRVQSAVVNLLPNSAFDTSASPFYTLGSGTSNRAFLWDGSKGRTADGSLMVTRTGELAASGDYAFYAYYFTVPQDGYYTFSGYATTDGEIIESHGAELRLEKWTANHGSSISGKSYSINYTDENEWKYGSITMQFTAGETIKCLVGIEDAIGVGSAWFDDLQLEYSPVPNTRNMLVNTDFSNGSANWELSDGVAVAANTQTLTFTGETASMRHAYQTVKVDNGQKGDIYSAGVWADAFSLPITQTADGHLRSYNIAVRFYKNGSAVGTQYINANAYLTFEQLLAGEIIAPADYDEIRFILEYNYNANTATFSKPYLYRENYGQSYVYDENGNIVSTEDQAEQESTFAYRDDQLINTLNPTGSRYMYAYTTKGQLDLALSSDGVMYDVKYDTYGNVTNTSTQAVNFVTEIEGNTDYLLVNAESGEVITGLSENSLGTTNFELTHPNSHWQLQSVSDDMYRIVEQGDSSDTRYLSVVDGVNAENQETATNITVSEPARLWRFEPQDDGTFGIFTTLSGNTRCLTAVRSEGRTSCDVVITSYVNDTLQENQRWYLYPSTPDSEYQITSSMTYTSDHNYLQSVTDTYGNTTQYNYNTSTGVLNSLVDALNHQTVYTYDADNDSLKQVSTGGQSVQYTYDTADRLTKISLNNVPVYHFVYDDFGRNTEVYIQGTDTTTRYTLSTNTYDTYGRLTSQQYGNANTVYYTYDSLDRVVKKSYNRRDDKTSCYYYDAFGRLSAVTDTAENTTTRYRYDLSGRLAEELTYKTAELSGTSIKYGTAYTYTEESGQLASESLKVVMGTGERSYEYGQPAEGEIPGAVYAVNSSYSQTNNRQEKIEYTYDEFGRIATRTVYLNAATGLKKTTTYTYRNEIVNGVKTTGTQVASETTDGVTTSYEYDAIGNITKISKNGAVYEEYTYDALNQLTQVVHYNSDGTTDTYEYTYNGTNLTATKKNGVVVNAYAYGDTTWKDRLTEFNGQLLTYDEIGNPIIYYKRLLEWSDGRRLVSAGGTTFTYDVNGTRLTKTTGDTTTTYQYAGGVLYGEQINNSRRIYLYDETGSVYGYIYNYDTYYFEKNVQGDVIGIWTANGVKIANYTYDAWGNVTSIINQYGEDVTDRPTHQGNLNPIRYRGYYYDTDIELYWLNTRFYDPETGRFINCDSVVSGVSESVHGYNPYAYCFNNPINFADHTGQWPTWADLGNMAVKVLERVVNAAWGAFQVEVGVGYGFGGSTKAAGAELSVEAYQDVLTVGIKGGDDYVAITGTVSVGIDVVDAVTFGVSTDYEHRFETNGETAWDGHTTAAAPWDVYSCPQTQKNPLQFNVPILLPKHGSLTSAGTIGMGGSFHFIVGGHYEVNFDTLEFLRLLVEG